MNVHGDDVVDPPPLTAELASELREILRVEDLPDPFARIIAVGLATHSILAVTHRTSKAHEQAIRSFSANARVFLKRLSSSRAALQLGGSWKGDRALDALTEVEADVPPRLKAELLKIAFQPAASVAKLKMAAGSATFSRQYAKPAPLATHWDLAELLKLAVAVRARHMGLVRELNSGATELETLESLLAEIAK